MDHLSLSLFHRRHFLQQATTGAIGTALVGVGFPMILPASVRGDATKPGANDRIRVGAIGVGGRGKLLLQQLPTEADLVAVSDCNQTRAEAYRGESQGKWDIYPDYRSILDRKDVDAVIVATGEFQRVLPCIHACQAGKDVYAEKPLTLYIREGRTLVDAVRKHDRVLQVGTQQRSMEVNRIACEFVRSGGLGKIREVRAINYSGPTPSPSTPLPGMPIPAGFDWNMWLNQAAERPYHSDWMGWMRWYDFAGGEMTNWGAHGVDQIQWALGMDDRGPVELRPIGNDSRTNTPATNGSVLARYDNGVEVHFAIEPGKGPMGGAVFIGEQGKLEINRNKFSSNPPELAEKLRQKLDIQEEERKWSDDVALWQARWHMQNWLDCIRSRKRPVADVEIGHRSVSFCHLVNITRRLGRALRWDPVSEQFVGDAEANGLLDRPRRAGFELPVIEIESKTKVNA